MARNKKPLPLLERVTIEAVAAEGKCLFHWQDMVVFVPWCMPGDVCDVQLRRKKHSFAEGEVVRFIEYSKVRATPFCQHFGVCGGCKWQNLPYEEQLRFKQQQVYDQLTRIGKVALPEFRPILGSVKTQEYRNKLDFGCANKRWLTKEEVKMNSDKFATAVPSGEGMAEANSSLSTIHSSLVTKSHIADVLSKTCKVDAMAMKDDDTERLATLNEQLSANIYGQDEAIRQVTEAVLTARAGLLDDNKPQASLLFVGPTGVGKTEAARVLARQLGIELVRFDMSEYTEKHTVAKLIGSPAGYVGYEDGGLLTDAIRKTPNCVLLLDEIEKAHQDIYNILLQVMDYARLTDNKGRKADFRNVILIMTSNAGAQYAAQASIGFQGNVSRGEAMLKQVKKTFKPEFINRLSATVVFHDMDRQMATLILRKKLRELQDKLTAKKVELTVTDEAFERLLSEGFTAEYGAREMDRVISQRLKPLLTRAILFGSLKNGGTATVTFQNNELTLT